MNEVTICNTPRRCWLLAAWLCALLLPQWAAAQTTSPTSSSLFDTLVAACSGELGGTAYTGQGCSQFLGLVFNSNADQATIDDAVDQIAPYQAPAQANSSFLQQDQVTALQERLRQIRKKEGRGVSVMNRPLYDDTAARGATGSGSAGDDSPFAATPWGFFLSGRYQNGDVDQHAGESGFDYDTTRVTAGADYRFNDALVMGGSLGYGRTSNDMNKDRGNVDLDNWTAWFYGNYAFTDQVYMDWSLGYGHNRYDGKRHIEIGTLRTTTDFSTDGHQYNASVSGGYDGNYEAWQYGGYARLDYIHTSIDAYRESGGDGLALALEEQQARSLQSTVGARVARAFSTGSGVWLPGLDIGFVKEWKQDERQITASLIEAPEVGNLVVTTHKLDDTYFNIGVNLTAVFVAGQSAYLRYQTMVGRSDVNDRIIEAGYRVEF